jgi:hypothetical protein
MNLRHVTAGDAALDHASIEDTVADDGARSILDDERLADELAGVVELAAAFLGSDGLDSAFASFTYGIDSLAEMRADLWRLGAWIRGNA